MNYPKVTFGICNCNRLHYLKSCVESLLVCTEDYPNREFIIVDNASIEKGTDEYLKEKSDQGFLIIRQTERDPANEFAKALNLIYKNSTGEFIVPLQGDQQFILKGNWLKQYVDFYTKNINHIGCITLDAQRKQTIESHTFSEALDDDFFIDYNKPPIMGAADAMFSRDVLELIYPWSESNAAHEGGGDSETKMLMKVDDLIKSMQLTIFCVTPRIPVACAIYNEKGTNARVRGNFRYSDYWPPKENFKYYKIKDLEEIKKSFTQNNCPYGIEDLVEPIGWKPLMDNGGWAKTPINPKLAKDNEYETI